MKEGGAMSNQSIRTPGHEMPGLRGLTRRDLLKGAAAVGGLSLLPFANARAAGWAPPQGTRSALAESPLIYISPLHADGRESSCHGEVWYCVDEGAVLVGSAPDRWKARAIRSGREEARLWVGDFGPVKNAGDRYRSAPSFKAKAELLKDDAVYARLLEAFGKKYSDSWGKWGPRFEAGWKDGSRALIRYTPISA